MYYNKYIKYKKKYNLLLKQKGGTKYRIRYYSIKNDGTYDSYDIQGIPIHYKDNCMFISLLTFLQIKYPGLSIEDLRNIAGLKEDTREVEYNEDNPRFNGVLQKISDNYNINIRIFNIDNGYNIINNENNLENDTIEGLNKTVPFGNTHIKPKNKPSGETVYIASFGTHFQLIDLIVNEDTKNILYILPDNNDKYYKEMLERNITFKKIKEEIIEHNTFKNKHTNKLTKLESKNNKIFNSDEDDGIKQALINSIFDEIDKIKKTLSQINEALIIFHNIKESIYNIIIRLNLNKKINNDKLNDKKNLIKSTEITIEEKKKFIKHYDDIIKKNEKEIEKYEIDIRKEMNKLEKINNEKLK